MDSTRVSKPLDHIPSHADAQAPKTQGAQAAAASAPPPADLAPAQALPSPQSVARGSFAHQVAVVTGAASGIGRAVCRGLAEQGARLVLIDRQRDALEETCAELAACGEPASGAGPAAGGDRLLPAVVDVTDREAVARAIDRAGDVLGPPDVLVASAGITGVTLVDDLNVELAEAIARINFLGVVYAIDAVLPSMFERGRGRIGVVSSLAGCRGMPFSAAYSASKAAVSKYVESMRPALRRRGIYVTTLYPGFVRTPLMENAEVKPPVPMLEPDRAAQYILYAIRRRKRTYGFPWSTSLVVRFLRWLPPVVYDWVMARGAAKIPDVVY